MPKQSEFEGKQTPTGVRVNPKTGHKVSKASDMLKVQYLNGTNDPSRPIDRKVWLGG